MTIKVASGEIEGNGLEYRKRFKVIEQVCYALASLEEAVGHMEDEIDWDRIFDGVPHLHFLSSDEYWPPFYDPRTFDSVPGFWTENPQEGEDDEGYGPGNSFERIEIFVKKEEATQILKDFRKVRANLKKYKPLKEYL